MRTDDLIAALSDEPAPVSRLAMAGWIAAGLGVGIIGSMVLMMTTIGVRPDLGPAMASSAFWMKFFYTLALAGLGVWIVNRVGRPGANPTRPLLLLMLPLIAILALASAQLGAAGGAERRVLLMGRSANVCGLLIAFLSVPLFGGLFWAMRKMAPTRPRLGGAAAGLLAGSVAATLYAFHCPESAAPFVAVWYTSGILLTTAVGALLGGRFLRW